MADPLKLAEMVRDAVEKREAEAVRIAYSGGGEPFPAPVDLAPIIAAWHGGEPSEAGRYTETQVRTVAAIVAANALHAIDTKSGELLESITTRALAGIEPAAPRTYTADEVRWMLEEAARQGAATHGVMGLQLHEQPFTIASRILSSPKAPTSEAAELYDSRAAWSLRTFGAGDRYKGVVEHIRRELLEIEAEPAKLEEWVDVVMLAMDGAWRSAGADGAAFWAAFRAKAAKNEARKWAAPDAQGVVEHVREAPSLPVVREPTCGPCRYRATSPPVCEHPERPADQRFAYIEAATAQPSWCPLPPTKDR